jgi:hypothetical protein
MRPKKLLQIIIGARQFGHIIAVKKTGPVAPGDFEKMCQRRGQQTGASPVPSHGAKQTAEAALHGRTCALFFVREDVGGTMDPLVSNAYRRPEGCGFS